MANMPINALVRLTSQELQRVQLDIHEGLLGTDDFDAIHALPIPETSLILQDMTVRWVQFRTHWSNVGAFVHNYAETVRRTVDAKLPISVVPRPGRIDAYKELVWREWAAMLRSINFGE